MISLFVREIKVRRKWEKWEERLQAMQQRKACMSPVESYKVNEKSALSQWHEHNKCLPPPAEWQTGRRTALIPGQQSHHSGDDADKVEHGVGHLALKDPVRVGRRVTGDADAAVDESHNEEDRHAAQDDHHVHHCLHDRDIKQPLDILITIITIKMSLLYRFLDADECLV